MANSLIEHQPQSSRAFRSHQKKISSEKERSAFRNALSLTKEYEDSDGHKIQDHFLSLSKNHSIVEGNYSELSEVIQRFSKERVVFPPRDTAQEEVQEFLRCLSNYVGSIKNRENQTRDIIIPELDEMCNSNPLISDQYKRKVSELGTDIHGYFFTGLRNHIVHEGLPQLIISMDVEESPRFGLKKEEILTSPHWSQEGKGYADAWEEEIFLDESINDFQNSLGDLYDWFAEYVSTRFKHKYEDQVEKAKRAKEAQERFFDLTGIEMMTIEWVDSDN